MIISNGIGVPVAPGGALSAGVTVQGMFAHGEKGFAYDLRSTAGLFQDAARTTPVTLNNDPIGGVLDISGLGNHGSNSGTTSRPLWQSTGFALLDGVANFLQSPAIDLTAAGSVTAFIKFESLNTAGTSAVIVYESSPNFNINDGAVSVYVNDTVANRNTVSQRQNSPAMVQQLYFSQSGLQWATVAYTVPAATTPVGIVPRVNGSAPSTTIAANTAITISGHGNYNWYLGARGGSSLFLNMRLHFMLAISRAITGAEQTYLESL